MANRFLSNITINDSYTFPSADGTNGQVITTDGSGNLSFSDISVTRADSNFIYYDVKNSSGSTINKGTAVMATGTEGNSGHILIAPMIADGTVEPRYFMGVLESTLTNGQSGRVIHFGKLSQFNTNAFEDGDVLWCDPATPGGFTTTEPEGPNLKIAAAIVINAATNGKIKVRVQGNEGLHELHDVKISTQANGDLLQWNNTLGVWENKTLASIADSRYVNVSGDTMTGDLNLTDADVMVTSGYGIARNTSYYYHPYVLTDGDFVVGTHAQSAANYTIVADNDGTGTAEFFQVKTGAGTPNILKLVSKTAAAGVNNNALTLNGNVVLNSANHTDYTDPKYLRSDANDVATGFIEFNNNSGIKVVAGGSTPDSTTNTYQQGTTITGGNMRLNIDVSDVSNGGAYIQTRHNSTSFPTATYTLALNPLGGNVTINGSVAWHAGNDGAASGLDADLLDGIHAAGFFRDLGDTGTVSDFDNLSVGINHSDETTATNQPYANHNITLTFDNDASAGRMAQIFISDNQTGGIWFRPKQGTSGWHDWSRLWGSYDFTSADISNWNTAYGWGNHAGLYLSSSGSVTIDGNLAIGSSSTQNYISFRGTTGDNPNGFNHTYIGENLYGGTEQSELLLFKGNDPAATSGPDRIRHIGSTHVFQTYSGVALSGTFNEVATSTVPQTAVEINNDKSVSFFDGSIKLYRDHVQADLGTWYQDIIFHDESDRAGARIRSAREAWDNAPMNLEFQTGGLNTTTTQLRIESSGKIVADKAMSIRGTGVDSTALTYYNLPTEASVNMGTFTDYGFIDISSEHGTYGGWIDFSKANGTDYAGRIRYRNDTERLVFHVNGNSTPAIEFGTTSDTTGNLYAKNCLRVYQRTEIWGGDGGNYLDVRNSSGSQIVKLDGSGGDSFFQNNLVLGGTSSEGRLDVIGSTINGTQAPDWSGDGISYNSNGDITISRRHGATKDSSWGYSGPNIDFRSSNSGHEWSVAQIMGTTDSLGASNHAGGLMFLTSSGGNTNSTGRRNQGAAPQVTMAIGGDGDVVIKKSLSIGQETVADGVLHLMNSAGTKMRHGLYGSIGNRYSSWDTWIGNNTSVATDSTSNIQLLTNYTAGGAAALKVGFQDLEFHQWTSTELDGLTAGANLSLSDPSFKIDTARNVHIAENLTVKGTSNGISVDTSGHASIRIDRGSTSFDNNLLFYTAGALDFRIWQDGLSNYLYVRDETGGAGNMVTFKKGGNVGIGADPDYKLDVAGEIGLDTYLRHRGDSDTYFGFNGENSIKFRTGGGDRLVIDNSGIYATQYLGLGDSTPDARFTLRGIGVSDASTTFGAILDRGTKIAWTNSGQGSTGEYIYSQSGSPYAVTIHSGGYNALACPNTGHVYINHESGTCSIGSTSFSTSYKLYVTGSIYATADVIAYSDKRKKENIVTIDSALDKVKNLRGVYYNKIDETDRNVGVIAQEVLDVVPEAVSYAEDKDEYGVKYGNLVGVLIEAMKEQQKQIEEQQKQIDELKNIINNK